ncbi:hypothetical protein C8R42DRAFT_706735, partial [Lentinula raphanica]
MNSNSRRLFIIICLGWIALMQALASPLPPADNPAEHHGQAPDQPDSTGVQQDYVVDVILVIMGERKRYEHWMLALGPIYVHALVSEYVDNNHMSVQKGVWKPSEFYVAPREIHLGKGRFKNKVELWNVVDDMLQTPRTLNLAVPSSPRLRLEESRTILQLPKPVMEKGGNCMDFLKLATEYLDSQGHFVTGEVKQNFQKEFHNRYRAVAKETLGRSICLSVLLLLYRRNKAFGLYNEYSASNPHLRRRRKKERSGKIKLRK